MTYTNETDMRRAIAMVGGKNVFKKLIRLDQNKFLHMAKLIRESDEAAGYTLCKSIAHEGEIA